MPTSNKELLETLQEQLRQENQKQKEFRVLVLQYKPVESKNTLDPEDIYTRREIDKISRELIRIQRENQNLEAYVDYLKNKDKPHVPDVEPPDNPHVPSVDPKDLPKEPKVPSEDPPIT